MPSQAGRERVQQKERTRAALLQAARELLEAGRTPAFQDIADHATISRATAYRYFSDVDVLLQEAALDGIAQQVDRLNLDTPADAALATRIDNTVTRIVDMVQDNEALFRTYLRGVVAGENRSVRGARRLRWLGDALGADLPAPLAQRVVHALSLLTGIETVVVARDVIGLDAAATRELCLWTARAILTAALMESQSS